MGKVPKQTEWNGAKKLGCTVVSWLRNGIYCNVGLLSLNN